MKKTATKRPAKQTGERPVVQFRVHQKVYEQLKASAEAQDLTMSEDAAERLERSFRRESDSLIGVILRHTIGKEPRYEPPKHGGHFAMSPSVKAETIARLTAFIESIPTAEESTLTDEEFNELSEMVDRANRESAQQKKGK